MFRAFQIICLAGIVVLAGCKPNGHQLQPQPKEGNTLVVSHENEQNQSNRKAWIESIHKAPPGVDWRTIERDNLRQKSKSLISRKVNAKNSDPEEFANGALSGEWVARGPSNQAGSIRATLYDPNDNQIFYISAGGTLFKTTLDGSSTQIVNQDLQFNDDYLARIIVNGQSRLLAKTGRKPHYSDDGGFSWSASSGIQITDLSFGRTDIEAYTNGNVILALSKQDYWDDFKLYSSIDGGESFQPLFNTGTNDDSLLELYKTAETDEIFLVQNKGDKVELSQYDHINENLTQLVDEIAAPFDGSITLKPAAVKLPNGLTRHYYYGVNKKVMYSDDQGVTFTQTGTMPTSPWGLIYALPSHPDILLMGEVEAYSSTDKGASWFKINEWGDYYSDISTMLHADIMSFNQITTNMGAKLVLTGHHGGLSKSFGALVANENITLDGISTAQYYDVRTHPTDPSIIYAGSQDQGFQRSSGQIGDGIHRFDQLVSGDYGKIAFANDNESMWTIYPGGDVAYFENAKNSTHPTDWYTITSDDESVWLPPLISGPDSSKDEIFVAGGNKDGGSGTYLLRLSHGNNGINVDQFGYNFNPASNGKITALGISRIDNKRFYVGTEEGAIFYTTDSGTTWDRGINNIPNGNYLYGAAILPSKVNADVVYVGGSGYTNPAVVMSDDGGKNFDAISQGLPSTTVFDLDMSPDGSLIFAATEAGPYVYITDENRWYDINGIDAPRQAYWSVEYLDSEDIVRFGTYGRGVWDFNITQNSVATIDRKEISGDFKVYPNPSSDGLYQMEVHLLEPLVSGKYDIFDSSGKQIVTKDVVNGERLSLDIDISGSPAGIYYFSLRNSTSQKTLTLYKH